MKKFSPLGKFLAIGALVMASVSFPDPAGLRAASVPAFPGAQGYGAQASGGRGGKVVFVTNLNDSGSGSLRDCVSQSGARICVFKVSGIIVLNSQLNFANPYLTVAGQTAPGGGITINGNNVLSQDPVRISTHDVVIQYVRIGVGYHAGRSDQTGDVISIYGGVYNVIIDHVSLRWGQDETFQMWSNGGGIDHVTLSNSILADPLSSHSTFLITGGGNSAQAATVTDNDWHHNLIVTGSHRIPLAKAGNDSFVNNIIYNWGFYANQYLGGGKHDIIGNIYKKGPWTNSNGYGGKHEIEAASSSGADALDGSPVLYVSGNKGWNQPDPSGDQAVITQRVTGENGSENGVIPSNWFAGAPSNNPTFPIVADPANSLDSTLLPHVGASRHLDCSGNWSSMRDSLDAGWASDYQNGTGSAPDSNSSFPTVASGTACPDTDNDGMFDAWESSHGLVVGTDDHNKAMPSGFTAIDEFLNPGGATTGTVPPPITPSPVVPPPTNPNSVIYEAESSSSVLSNGTKIFPCAGCSGTTGVGLIGGGASGKLQFNNISVAKAGIYDVTIAYINGSATDRPGLVSVNGNAPVSINLPVTGSWDTPKNLTVELSLNAGNNTLLFYNNSSVYMADIDKVEVPKEPKAVLTVQPPAVQYTSQVLVNNKSLYVAVTPVSFQNGSWNYRVDWKRTLNRTGSLYIYPYGKTTAALSIDSAPQTGSKETGFALLPGKRYKLEFYAGANKKSTLLARKYFTALPAPADPQVLGLSIDALKYWEQFK